MNLHLNAFNTFKPGDIVKHKGSQGERVVLKTEGLAVFSVDFRSFRMDSFKHKANVPLILESFEAHSYNLESFAEGTCHYPVTSMLESHHARLDLLHNYSYSRNYLQLGDIVRLRTGASEQVVVAKDGNKVITLYFSQFTTVNYKNRKNVGLLLKELEGCLFDVNRFMELHYKYEFSGNGDYLRLASDYEVISSKSLEDVSYRKAQVGDIVSLKGEDDKDDKEQVVVEVEDDYVVTLYLSKFSRALNRNKEYLFSLLFDLNGHETLKEYTTEHYLLPCPNPRKARDYKLISTKGEVFEEANTSTDMREMLENSGINTRKEFKPPSLASVKDEAEKAPWDDDYEVTPPISTVNWESNGVTPLLSTPTPTPLLSKKDKIMLNTKEMLDTLGATATAETLEVSKITAGGVIYQNLKNLYPQLIKSLPWYKKLFANQAKIELAELGVVYVIVSVAKLKFDHYVLDALGAYVNFRVQELLLGAMGNIDVNNLLQLPKVKK